MSAFKDTEIGEIIKTPQDTFSRYSKKLLKGGIERWELYLNKF
jgi:hypothetical protein